jgi:hypothetical protein
VTAAALLKTAGEALYGRDWQSAIARDLGVSARMVRFWAAGERKAPEDRLRAVKVLLARREVDVAAVWEKFEEKFPDV